MTQRLALLPVIAGPTPFAKTAIVAAGVAFVLILINLIMSCFLPEPKHDMVAE